VYAQGIDFEKGEDIMRRVLALLTLGALTVLVSTAALTGVNAQGSAANTFVVSALDTINCSGVDIPSPAYSGVPWVVGQWEMPGNSLCNAPGSNG